METFTWIPDWAPQGEEAPRVLKSAMGDGYTQRTADGTNTNLPKWALTFSNRSQAEYLAILTFLRARNAVEPFLFTPPGDSQLKVICPNWKLVPWDGGASFSLSCAFEAQP